MATSFEGPPPPKRSRGENGAILSYQNENDGNADDTGSPRTSSLSSPTLQLRGHNGSVYALEYSPNGEVLCSTSFDMTCLLWNHPNYDNFNVLKGHKNAVLDCTWCDNETIVTASADKTLQIWDVLTGSRIRKWQDHTAIVNAVTRAVDPTHDVAAAVSNVVVSASDDGTCRIWDRRQKPCTGTLSESGASGASGGGAGEKHNLPMIAVAATDKHAYTAGLDNLITCWDLGTQRKIYACKGHQDTITSLSIHPEGTHVLSNSMDHTLQTWDIRPYVPGKNRHVKTFRGHKHNAEKGLLKCHWSPNGNLVTGGSADRLVHIWDEFSTEELYVLPGHAGCVNTVLFHPVENVIASGSSDKSIFVGELS